MGFLLFIAAGFFLTGAFIFWEGVDAAQPGYQDERGFHFGDKE